MTVALDFAVDDLMSSCDGEQPVIATAPASSGAAALTSGVIGSPSLEVGPASSTTSTSGGSRSRACASRSGSGPPSPGGDGRFTVGLRVGVDAIGQERHLITVRGEPDPVVV